MAGPEILGEEHPKEHNLKISFRDNINFKISSRETKAYMGQELQHEPVPNPSNWLIPENDNPSKYTGISDQYFMCPSCTKKVKLIKPKGAPKTDLDYFQCPECNARFSHLVRDRGYSHYSTTPGLLNWDNGSSTNNEQGGVQYHTENFTNRDTWSGNLGS